MATCLPAVVLLVGCTPGTPATSPPDIVQHVIDHAAEFTPAESPLNTSAGTVLDPLIGVSGCWAWMSDGGAYTQGGVYQFDLDSGQYHSWTFASGARGVQEPQVLTEESGQFRIADPARLELTPNYLASLNPLTGLLEPANLAGSPPRLVYVTLSGDQSQVHTGSPADGPQGEPPFRRFACLQ